MSVKWLKGFGHESLILRQFSQDSWPNTRKRRIIICRSRLSGLLPCVASWKPVLFAHFLNAELLGAIASYIEQSSKLKQEIKARNQAWCDMLSVCVCVSLLHTHQISEATHRKTTGSCDKLQQSHPLLIVHLLHKLSTYLSVNILKQNNDDT